MATWCEELTHWKRLWCWERLRAGAGEGDRGWDGWMASWLNEHEFEQILGNSEGQGSLACCSPRGHKASVMTERLTEQQQQSRWSVCLETGHSWEGEWWLWPKWSQWPWGWWKWMDFMNHFRGRGDRTFGVAFQCCIFYSTIMREKLDWIKNPLPIVSQSSIMRTANGKRNRIRIGRKISIWTKMPSRNQKAATTENETRCPGLFQ